MSSLTVDVLGERGEERVRAVVQRVSSGSVTIDTQVIARIGRGLVVLLGIRHEDGKRDVKWLVEKIVHLRIFADHNGRMNLSVADIEGEVLIVSQFTLYGDCRKGRRPGFSNAARPEAAESLYHYFIEEMQAYHLKVVSGTFQADMKVALTNDGPVTLLLDSEKIL